nr:MAG TPA: hypothetical protein [Caudoviricetes sp.]
MLSIFKFVCYRLYCNLNNYDLIYIDTRYVAGLN